MPTVSTPAAQAALEELVAHAVSLHAARGGDLLGCFTSVVDPRARRGVRHRLAAILAMCTAAVLCGCTSLDDITAWIGGADPRVLAALGCRRDAAGMLTPPHPETVTRVLADLGAQGLADHLAANTSSTSLTAAGSAKSTNGRDCRSSQSTVCRSPRDSSPVV